MTAVLALPFSFLSCGEEKKVEGESKDDPAGETVKKDHTQIGQEIETVMAEMMTGMSSISDVESAQAFVVAFETHKASLKELVKEAEALAPPSDEEKAAVQKLKDDQDAKGEELKGKLMKIMTENPDAEAIGAEMGKVMANKEMAEITDKIEEIYGLETDEPTEGEPGAE